MSRYSHAVIFVVASATVLAVLAVALVWLSKTVVERVAQRDVEMRSELVFNSIRDRIEREMGGDTQALRTLFERVTGDERILALGLCDGPGRMIIATKRMPAQFACPMRVEEVRFRGLWVDGERLVIGAFPVHAGSETGTLLVLHERGFVTERVGQAGWYLIMAGLTLIVLIGVLATLAVVMPATPLHGLGAGDDRKPARGSASLAEPCRTRPAGQR